MVMEPLDNFSARVAAVAVVAAPINSAAKMSVDTVLVVIMLVFSCPFIRI
jgi:hypothetical protein